MTSSQSITQIPLFKVFMSPESSEYALNTLQSGFISQGKKVDEFETKLKQYFKSRSDPSQDDVKSRCDPSQDPYILTVNSATAGLTLAIRLLDLPSESEILCTPLTCFATTCAVLENRMNIRWVDVDLATANMSLDDLKSKISEKTGAIVFVHWAGSPIDLDKLKEIAVTPSGRKIPIIEDCAHAFGATYDNKPLGMHGNIAVYSFQAIKHLTSGDGGAIILPDEKMYNRAKLLRWFGISREKPTGVDFRLENDIKEWGYKFHMNDINASIGLGNLLSVSQVIDRHVENGNYYEMKLKNLFGVSTLKQVEKGKSVYWIYSLKVKAKTDFIKHMESRGICVSQVHNRNDLHTAVKKFYIPLPNMDLLEQELISIPVGWWVTNEDREKIVLAIQEWSEKMLNRSTQVPTLLDHTVFFSPYDLKLNTPFYIPNDSASFEIRQLNRKDKEPFLALLKELNGFECDKTKFDLVFSSLPLSQTQVLLLTRNQEIISTLRILFEKKFFDDVAHIEDVVTLKKYRRKGYGSMLISYAKSVAIATSYKVVLSTKEQNCHFYSNCGFEKSGFEMVVRK